MQVRIYKPAKNPMQSGKNLRYWLIEFVCNSKKNRFIESYLARISSEDMLNSEVKLSFKTKEEALRFAIKNNFDYEVIEPKHEKLIKKSYANNFK